MMMMMGSFGGRYATCRIGMLHVTISVSSVPVKVVQGCVGSRFQKLTHFGIMINLDTTWNDVAPVKFFQLGELKAIVYAFQQLYKLILQAREFELHFVIRCC